MKKPVKWKRIQEGGEYADVGDLNIVIRPPLLPMREWDVVISNLTPDGFTEGWYVARYSRAKTRAQAKRIGLQLVRLVKKWRSE